MQRIDTYTCDDCGAISHYRPCGNRLSWVQAAIEELIAMARGGDIDRVRLAELEAKIRDDIEITSEAFR